MKPMVFGFTSVLSLLLLSVRFVYATDSCSQGQDYSVAVNNTPVFLISASNHTCSCPAWSGDGSLLTGLLRNLELAALNRTVALQQTNLSAHQAQLSTQRDQIAALNSTVAQQRAQIASLNVTAAQQQSLIAAQQAQLAGFQARLATVESAVNATRSCPVGSFVRSILSDGTIICGPPPFAGGGLGSNCFVNSDCSAGLVCIDSVGNGVQQCLGAVGYPCSIQAHCAPMELCVGSACMPQTCKYLKLYTPSSNSGTHLVDGDGFGGADSFLAYCDMSQDDGGWMLVTPSMIADQVAQNMTVVNTVDANGGLNQTNTMSGAQLCSNLSDTAARFWIRDTVAWTQIRYDMVFHGYASCWSIFGQETKCNIGHLPQVAVPCDAGLVVLDRADGDVLRNEFHMAGAAGTINGPHVYNGTCGAVQSGWDGTTRRCDNMCANMWHASTGVPSPRSATVIQRRSTRPGLAGLGAGINCITGGQAGWQYSNIYVR